MNTLRPLRRTFAVGLAVLVSGVGMLLWSGVADAGESVEVSVDRVGWWSSRPGATETGAEGFEVSTGPEGSVQGIAAFEVTFAAAAVDNADILLTESAALAEFSSLKLCTTVDTWEPADPGALAQAPEPDCTVSVSLTRTLDSFTWLGNITPLVADGGTTTIMVVPEYTPPPPSPLGTGMFVRIESIEIAAEGSQQAPAITPTTLDFTTPGGGNTFEPTPDAGAIVDFGPGPSFSGGSPSFDTGGAASLDDLGAGAPEPDVAPLPDASDDEDFFTLGEVEEISDAPRPWFRLVFLIPLSAAIGYATIRVKALFRDRADPLAA